MMLRASTISARRTILLAELDRCAVRQELGSTTYKARRHIANVDDGIRSQLFSLYDHPVCRGQPSPAHHLGVFGQFAAKDESDQRGEIFAKPDRIDRMDLGEPEDFDPEAVEEYLQNLESSGPAVETLACGCPSTQMQTFETESACQAANQPQNQSTVHSNLGHWPVQIKLVPPHAQFLQDANLLILADCAAVAYAGLHQELLKDRVVMMGCPKFDDVPEYVERFTEIFKKNDVNSITAVIMEVPCCSGLPMMVKNGLEAAGKIMPIKKIVISTSGKLLKEEAI